MSLETTMVAEQCRLRKGAVQIRGYQSRPAGMRVVEWCAYLENISGAPQPPQIVPAEPGVLQMYVFIVQ